MPKSKPEHFQNSLVTPIYCNATFFFDRHEQAIDYHKGDRKRGRYGRYDNPNWQEVECQLAALDRCESALLFPSGMAAVSGTMLSLLSAGDEVLFSGKGYRNITAFCSEVLTRLGFKVHVLDVKDPRCFARRYLKLMNERVRIVFLEIPSNPLLHIADLSSIVANRGPRAIVVVDSTLATPVNFKPHDFGADLVLHSCGKYIGGHADIMAGSIAGGSDTIARIRRYRDVAGVIPDSFTAFLLNRSLATLELRMKDLNVQGMAVAKYLQTQRNVRKVYYTGLPDHPHATLAATYLTGHGGVVSFELRATKRQAMRFVEHLRDPFMGTNFGSQHSMVELCSVFTYYNQTPRERIRLGISDTLIRLNVGHGQAGRVIEDLEAALRVI